MLKQITLNKKMSKFAVDEPIDAVICTHMHVCINKSSEKTNLKFKVFSGDRRLKQRLINIPKN